MPRTGAWRRLPSGTRNSTGTSGSWRRSVARKLSPKIAGGFTHLLWQNWGPDGWFDQATFERVGKSFDNPDWVAVTLHSYRPRWGEAELDPRSLWLEEKVKETRTLALPTVYFEGEEDGVNPSQVSEGVHKKFSGPFDRILLQNVGNFPKREDPEAVARELTVFLGERR